MGAATAVSWGEILWDLFPDGPVLGGAPANVAFHLAQLGRSTALVSRVGDDERGREARRALTAAGVDTGAVQVDPDRPTGAVNVDVDPEGNASYSLNRGGAWEHIAWDEAARQRVRSAAALCYGTFCQRNRDAVDAMEQAIATAPPGCLRVCDPNLRRTGIDDGVLERALTCADVVKLNHREAERIEALFGARDAVSWLRDRGARVVALTRGAGGARLVGPNGEHDHPGLPVSGGDTVGAGDVYTAVLVHMLLEQPGDPDLERINRAANAAGAFVASQRGATPRLPDHILRQVAK